MDLGVDFDLVALWLVGDRLPRSASTVLGYLVIFRPYVNDLIACPLPLTLLDSPIDLGRFPFTNNEISIKLEIG